MRRAASQAALLVRSRLADSGATSSCRAFSSEPVTAALFPGDGIGPEIADAVRNIFTAQGVPIEWEEQYISKTADPRTNSMVTRENLDSVLVRCASSLIIPFLKQTKLKASTNQWYLQPSNKQQLRRMLLRYLPLLVSCSYPRLLIRNNGRL
jgi:isocitrate/isopropylmalate dehydrogenase